MEREQAVKFMHDLLRAMVAKKASDLFITVGFPPAIKLDGKMTPVAQQSLTAQHTSELARGIMNDKQAGEFEATKECNFAVSPGDIGRFFAHCVEAADDVRFLIVNGSSRPVKIARLNLGVAEGALPFELRQAASRYPVTLYTAATCIPCDNGRQMLQQRGTKLG